MGHRYDLGICIYCDRCQDEQCCQPVKCDKRCVPDTKGIRERVSWMVDEAGAPPPPPLSLEEAYYDDLSRYGGSDD